MSREGLQVALVSVSMSCTSTWNTTVWPSSRRAEASWALPSQPNWNASSPPDTRNQGLCVPRIRKPALRAAACGHLGVDRALAPRYCPPPLGSAVHARQDRPVSHPLASLPAWVVSVAAPMAWELLEAGIDAAPRRVVALRRQPCRETSPALRQGRISLSEAALALRTRPHALAAHGYATGKETRVAAAARVKLCGGGTEDVNADRSGSGQDGELHDTGDEKGHR